MTSLNTKKQSGFTIVELLIVIVVIAILALLVITTYGGIQARARNAKRQTDIQSVQTQLEAFYSQNGYYPSLKDMQDDTDGGFLQEKMKSLDTGALVDPSNSNQTYDGSQLTSTPSSTAKSYAYHPENADGDSCEDDDTTCASYTLTATYEGQVNGSSTYVKKNLD